jgi:hypothetical protein
MARNDFSLPRMIEPNTTQPIKTTRGLTPGEIPAFAVAITKALLITIDKTAPINNADSEYGATIGSAEFEDSLVISQGQP